MKKHLLFTLPFLLLLQSACSNDDDQVDPDVFRSQLTLETEDETISLIEDDPTPYAVWGLSKSYHNQVDSSEYVIMSGLGKRESFEVEATNTLHISFIRRFKGFNIDGNQFRLWVSERSHDYVTDGFREDGIGVIWIDENGEVWASGKNVGVEGLIYANINTETYKFPDIPTDQQNSNFLVVFSQSFTPPLPGFDVARRLQIEFNCTLYNQKKERLEIKGATFDTVLNFSREL